MDHPPDIQLRDDSKRVRFDGTINAGHIMTAIMFGAGLVTMWTNFKISEADMSSRLKAHDDAIVDLRTTAAHIVETQQQQTLTEQKLSLTLDYLAKQRQQP